MLNRAGSYLIMASDPSVCAPPVSKTTSMEYVQVRLKVPVEGESERVAFPARAEAGKISTKLVFIIDTSSFLIMAK